MKRLKMLMSNTRRHEHMAMSHHCDLLCGELMWMKLPLMRLSSFASLFFSDNTSGVHKSLHLFTLALIEAYFPSVKLINTQCTYLIFRLISAMPPVETARYLQDVQRVDNVIRGTYTQTSIFITTTNNVQFTWYW